MKRPDLEPATMSAERVREAQAEQFESGELEVNRHMRRKIRARRRKAA